MNEACSFSTETASRSEDLEVGQLSVMYRKRKKLWQKSVVMKLIEKKLVCIKQLVEKVIRNMNCSCVSEEFVEQVTQRELLEMWTLRGLCGSSGSEERFVPWLSSGAVPAKTAVREQGWITKKRFEALGVGN